MTTKGKIGPTIFGKLLSGCRLQLYEMGQREFAKLLEISPSRLANLEKGKVIPSIGQARKMAKKLRESQKLFMEMALQSQLNREGLKKLKVSLYYEWPKNLR